MRLLFIIIRFIRWVISTFMFTFVADCPRCHKHFYGFHSYAEQAKLDDKHYRIICHRCAEELDKSPPPAA